MDVAFFLPHLVENDLADSFLIGTILRKFRFSVSGNERRLHVAHKLAELPTVRQTAN